jgi:hypothetical protein
MYGKIMKEKYEGKPIGNLWEILMIYLTYFYMEKLMCYYLLFVSNERNMAKCSFVT